MRESIIEKLISMESDSFDRVPKKKKEELISKLKGRLESLNDDTLIEELINAARWAGKLEERQDNWVWD